MPLLMDEAPREPDTTPYVVTTGGAHDRRQAFNALAVSLAFGLVVVVLYVVAHVFVGALAFAAVVTPFVALYWLIVAAEAKWTFSPEGFDYKASSLFGRDQARVAASDIAEAFLITRRFQTIESHKLGFRLKNGRKMVLARKYKRREMVQILQQVNDRLPHVRWPVIR